MQNIDRETFPPEVRRADRHPAPSARPHLQVKSALSLQEWLSTIDSLPILEEKDAVPALPSPTKREKRKLTSLLREINRITDKPSAKVHRKRNLDITLAMAKIPLCKGQVMATDMIADGDGKSAMRGCLFCGTRETPQWRFGPLGASTLCNRCGVKYKKESSCLGVTRI